MRASAAVPVARTVDAAAKVAESMRSARPRQVVLKPMGSWPATLARICAWLATRLSAAWLIQGLSS